MVPIQQGLERNLTSVIMAFSFSIDGEVVEGMRDCCDQR